MLSEHSSLSFLSPSKYQESLGVEGQLWSEEALSITSLWADLSAKGCMLFLDKEVPTDITGGKTGSKIQGENTRLLSGESVTASRAQGLLLPEPEKDRVCHPRPTGEQALLFWARMFLHSAHYSLCLLYLLPFLRGPVLWDDGKLGLFSLRLYFPHRIIEICQESTSSDTGHATHLKCSRCWFRISLSRRSKSDIWWLWEQKEVGERFHRFLTILLCPLVIWVFYLGTGGWGCSMILGSCIII